MNSQPQTPSPTRSRPSPIRAACTALASLRLTVFLLALSLVLIFVATLDQVHLGVWGVQSKYFYSFLVLAKIPGTDLPVPVFPGGYLLGCALLVNLVTAHAFRFRWSWRKTGIWLAHAGLIILIIGEGLSGMMQRDGQVRINVGQSHRYIESFRETELAISDATNPAYDEVVSIPVSRLESQDPIQHPKLPFVVKALAYYPNAKVRARSQMPGAPSFGAAQVDGADMAAEPVPVTYKPDENNWPTAYVQLSGPDGVLGTWLVSTMLEEPQAFTYQGHTWELAMRPVRDYLPFTLTLQKFTHDIYPGTDIPKNFASTIHLHSDDGRDDRSILISMNNPLRYGGIAFYQAGYANEDRTSVLQAVRNPSWQIPYYSCALIGLGLVIQFGIGLAGFFGKRAAAALAAARLADPKSNPSSP
jgi:hypothetical protein